VRLGVYDVLGKEVALLVNEIQQPGRYSVRFDASHLASGVYVAILRAGSYAQSMRLMLVR
jgi:hypothetical protein